LAVRTLTEQAAAVADHQVSPSELVEASLGAVERVEDLTNAFTIVIPDDAMMRARSLEGSGPRGPLHGVPIAVKDLYDVAGTPTSGCCAAYMDRMATDDSEVVSRLRAAGAIVVAKTNMHELAFGATTQVSCFGGVRNPWDTERIPAGSSGGSGAAVASRAVMMAMGSDTGGSIRLPSAMCGVTGLKPTHGSVSLRGALPMTASFDTGGPLAVSADDCLLVHRIVAGFDPGYVYSRAGAALAVKNVADVRIGVLHNWISLAEPAVSAAVEVAADELRRAGCTLVDVDGVDPAAIRDAAFPVLVGEFAHHFRDIWDNDRVHETIQGLMTVGRQVLATEYAAGREAALKVHLGMLGNLGGVDALLAPGAPFTAPRIDEVDNLTEAIRSTVFTLPVNAAGLPSIAFPIGFSEGLPVGAQLIGTPWSEELLCGIVSEYQRATDWHLQAAPVASSV
jgi:aspartyl-tRNA(Asn)/glutamyl-tRNA(Gln) amidotransferase subunit A